MTALVQAVRAGRLLARPGELPARLDARIILRDGAIAEVVDDSGLADGTVGGAGTLALPGLANAHEHGRGLRGLAWGATDQALELWMSTIQMHPPVDPYVTSAAAFARLVRGGTTASVHCHHVQSTAGLREEAVAACRAATDVGLRLAFVVPMRDRHRHAYAEDDEVLAVVDPGDREIVRARWPSAAAPVAQQMELVESIAERCESRMIQVQYGPAAPQWCSDALLEAIAAGSERTGRRVHMHLLETRYQREWADAAYPDGLIRHLDRLGILSPRLTVAHGVWLRPGEWEILRERGVIVSINSSSNLRLRSGIAQAAEMARSGVSIALGLDSLSFDDDDDALRELRLAYLLHAGRGMEDGLTRAALFQASMRTGARAVTGMTNFGVIEPGRPADLVLLDYDAMAEDAVPGVADETDIVLARATGRFVQAVVVAGRQVVREGKVLGIDEPSVTRELAAQARKSADGLREAAPFVRRYHERLREFYRSGRHQRR